jgi:uncharacterized membrane protein YccC
VLFTLGSVYAWLVSLPWPEQPAVQPPGKTGMPGWRPMLDYGIRVGLAGAVCAAGGFALDLDHVGWPTAAALLVMRPAKEMQQLRSIGRPISVCVGALVAIGLIEIGASEAALAAATALAVIAATATVGSSWYITPLFTTLLVFLLMLYGAPQQASGRFWERITETLAGVAVAYFFGLLVPQFQRMRRPLA